MKNTYKKMLEDLKYFWEQPEKWLLVELDISGLFDCPKGYLFIESKPPGPISYNWPPEVEKEVMRRMIEAGVPIVKYSEVHKEELEMLKRRVKKEGLELYFNFEE